MGPGDRVLDVATGTGAVVQELLAQKHCSVVGVDQSPKMLDVARARLPSGVQLVEASAERLPFEDAPNAFISGDPKLVEMKYFFTRKLMLLKESDGYAVLPGGFGTMDEAFELLTLLQTGKAEPSPLVFVDVPEGSYWRAWERFVTQELGARGLVSPDDTALYRITDDVACAAQEVLGFYRTYHSLRVVGDLSVIRLRTAPSDDKLALLNREFADICAHGDIHRTDPLPQERAGRDNVDLPRIALHFDRIHYGRLRQLIDALNRD